MDDDNFDWSASNRDVILPQQRTTAVYLNSFGQAVIRQERLFDEEEDPYVAIDHTHLPRLIAALQEIARRPDTRGEPSLGQPPANV